MSELIEVDYQCSILDQKDNDYRKENLLFQFVLDKQIEKVKPLIDNENWTAKEWRNKIHIELSSNLIIDIPYDLKYIAESIKSSESILELDEDWDDQGSKPYQRETWIRSAKFIINYSKWLFENYNFFVKEPEINPGPDGSIDLVWRTDKNRMLINIPEDQFLQAGYYGDNYKNQNSIKGKISIDGIEEFFALWLKNLKK